MNFLKFWKYSNSIKLIIVTKYFNKMIKNCNKFECIFLKFWKYLNSKELIIITKYFNKMTRNWNKFSLIWISWLVPIFLFMLNYFYVDIVFLFYSIQNYVLEDTINIRHWFLIKWSLIYIFFRKILKLLNFYRLEP